MGVLWRLGPITALCGLLLARLAPDVLEEPLYEDEAVAGLIAMRPLAEVLDTVLFDRGGAPLHFVLAHGVFRFDASAEALRWISVVCALAAVPVVWDLGRRLGGAGAGVVAAAVVATSTALEIYGSFGRMYALFVLVAAIAVDLFVRAVDLRTTSAVAWAAAGAWLLPAAHPYGAIPALAMLVVAAVLWRRRSLAPVLPVAAAAFAATPFAIADLRLADRASVGGGESLASPADAWGELVAALSAFAGGDGVFFAALTGVAIAGLMVLLRARPEVAAIALALFVPPALFVLLSAGSAPDLSPRHLFYGLPLWAAAVGVGTTRLAALLPGRLGLGLFAAVVVLAAVAPSSSLRDPRGLGVLPTESTAQAEAGAGDLLFPYAAPFLADLDDVQGALALPQGPPEEILETLTNSGEPIRAILVARPRGGRWEVARREGPFTRAQALEAAAEVLREPAPGYEWWHDLVVPELCAAAAELGGKCPA